MLDINRKDRAICQGNIFADFSDINGSYFIIRIGFNNRIDTADYSYADISVKQDSTGIFH